MRRRQTPRLARPEVVGEYVRRLDGRAEAVDEVAAFGRDHRPGQPQPVHDAPPRQRDLRAVDGEARVAVRVLVHDQPLSGRIGDQVEIPRGLEDDPFAVADDRLRVATGVRGVVEPAGRPGRRPEERLVLVRREQLRLSLERHEPEVVVPGLVGQLLDGDRAAVRREHERLAEAARREQRALHPASEVAQEDVEVDAVLPVARVREQTRVARELRAPVDELGLDDERLQRAARLEQVELRSLVAARVHRREYATVRQELAADRLRFVGQLL